MRSRCGLLKYIFIQPLAIVNVARSRTVNILSPLLLRKDRKIDHGRNRSRLSVKSFHRLMYQPNIVGSFFFQTVSFGTCLSNYKTTTLEVVYTAILSNYTEIAQIGVIIYTLTSSASQLQVKRTLTQMATSSFSTSSQFDIKELKVERVERQQLGWLCWISEHNENLANKSDSISCWTAQEYLVDIIELISQKQKLAHDCWSRMARQLICYNTIARAVPENEDLWHTPLSA